MADEAQFRAALDRGRWDIDYFSEYFLGVVPHPGQTPVVEDRPAQNHIWLARGLPQPVHQCGQPCGQNPRSGHLHRTLHALQARYASHPRPVVERSKYNWLKAPYDWWHFGLQGEVSELVHLELARLLSGTHPAQKGRGCRLVDLLGPSVAETQKKERGDYPWFSCTRRMGGGEIHFRSTSEKALGSLGKEMNGVSWDECAFSSDFDFVVDEVLNNRRLGTGWPDGPDQYRHRGPDRLHRQVEHGRSRCPGSQARTP